MHPKSTETTADESASASDRLFPEGFTLAAAAILGAVIVLAGLLLWQPGGDRVDAADTTAAPPPGPTGTPPTTSPSTTSPSTRSTTPGAPATTVPGGAAPTSVPSPGSGSVAPLDCPAGVDPVICDAAAFVQKVRGRAFREFPVVELLADADFDQSLLGDFENFRDEIEDQGVTLQALGLLDPDVSLADAYRDALEIGVVGFYDPEIDRLVVRGQPGESLDGLGLHGQLVLVHELVHAFDDQWFDLDREDFADAEAEYGFVAVVEGNARRVDQRWRSELDPARRSELEREEVAALSPDDLLRYFSLPPVLQQLQVSPYIDGARFVEHIASSGGEAAVDEALADPPVSSEEILNPDLSRAADPEIPVALPAAAGPLAEEGRLGELMVRIWLGPVAGEGWGGSGFRSWRDGDRSCIAVDLAADSPADLDEIQRAARNWAAATPGERSVDTVTVDGSPLLRASGCAG